MKFVTEHSKNRHKAESEDGTTILVPAQPTEIELVLELNKLGVDLKEYDYETLSNTPHRVLWGPR